MTYRTEVSDALGRWKLTIVREGGPTDSWATASVIKPPELVAVVINEDQALAERICALLNADEKPTGQRAPTEELTPEVFEEVRAALRHLLDPQTLLINGEAQVSASAAPPAARGAPVGGSGRPDALGGSQPPHATCIDVTNLRAGRAPRSEWVCGPDCPRETVHLIRDGSATAACCYQTPFELAYRDGHRLTVEPDAVTCGIVPREPERKADQ